MIIKILKIKLSIVYYKVYLGDYVSDNKDFENKVKLVINGNDIELNKFTDDIIKETILGLLKAIKTSEYGVDEVKNVEISIDNE